MGKISYTKRDGGLGRRVPSADKVDGLVMGGVAASGLALGVVSDPIINTQQAEALGIDADYDATNKVLVYYHISEYFRMNPDGELYLMLVAQGTTLANMCDVEQPYVYKMIGDTQGRVKRIGVVLNPATAYVPVLAGGFEDDVIAAIPKAKATRAAHAAQFRFCAIFIEGRNMNGTGAAMDDLRALESEVFTTALADPAISKAEAEYNFHAAVGTTLGVISSGKVSWNPGWTERFNLQDKATGRFLEVGTSGNVLARTFEAEYDILNQKGVIFGRTYPQQAGVFLNDYPSCMPLDSDYAYGTEIEVSDKALRLLYSALFPKVNAPLKVDKETGKLEGEVVKALERIGQRPLNDMERDEEISGGECYIDPDQDIRTQGKLIVKASLVNIETGREIEISIGFEKNL